MQNNNYIEFENEKIKIICHNDLMKELKKEYGLYYKFLYGNEICEYSLYIYIDEKKYNDVTKNINIMKSKRNIVYIIDRYGYVALNKDKNELIVIYAKLNDNVVQFVGEIIISLFGIIFEKKEYFFMHAACVDKKSKGIAIIGNKGSGKTSLLNFFLQNGYNYVTNSHLGLIKTKDYIKAIGAPSRMGMRIETLNKIIRDPIKERIINYSEFKNRFGNNIDEVLSDYRNKKFNIKVSEIKKIYNVSIKPTTKISTILIPIYMPELEHIKIKKLDEEEKKENIVKYKTQGAYSSTKYIGEILGINNISMPNLNNINIYKIYENEGNIREIFYKRGF